MMRLSNIVAIYAFCLALLAVSGPEILSVVGLLFSIVAVCTSMVLKQPWPLIPQGAFYVIALVFPPAIFFLPPVAYIATYDHIWGFRLAWIVVFIVEVFVQQLDMLPLGALFIISLAAMLLAIHSIREESDRRGLVFANNTLREQNLALAKERDELLQKNNLANAHANFEQELFADLSPRELAIVRLIAEGMDNKQIASELYLSEGTVRNHVSAILAKKQLSHRTQIAVTYYRGT